MPRGGAPVQGAGRREGAASWAMTALRWLPAAAFVAADWVVSGTPAERLGPLPAPDWLLHGLAYLVFGAALRLATAGSRRSGPISLAVALGYGAVDEWHQSWVPGRTPSLGDWAADAVGSALGWLAARWLEARAGRRRGGGRPGRGEAAGAALWVLAAAAAGVAPALTHGLPAPAGAAAPAPDAVALYAAMDEARKALEAGDPARALAWLEQAPGALEAAGYAAVRLHSLRARALLALGQADAAAAEARRALALAQEDDRPEAGLLLAEALRAAGDPAGAFDALLDVAEDPALGYRGPLRPAVLEGLAALAGRVDPATAEGRSRLLRYARALERLGRWQQAASVLSATPWAQERLAALSELGRVLGVLGQPERQRQVLQQALEEARLQGLAPAGLAGLRLQLADALQSARATQEAESLLRQVIDEAPGSAAAGEALSRLVRAALDRGDRALALRYVEAYDRAAAGTAGWREALGAALAAACDAGDLAALDAGADPAGIACLAVARDLLQRLAAGGARDAAALYWQARLQPADRPALTAELLQRFPLSYYAVLARQRWPELAAAAADPPSPPPPLPDPAGPLPPEVAALEAAGRRDDARRELRYRLAADVPAGPTGAAPKAEGALATLVRWEMEAGEYRAALRHGQRLLGPEAPWAWGILFPRPYAPQVLAASAAQGVDPLLVWAVMREESAFEPQALSGADAYGLMQLVPATGQWVAQRLGLAWGSPEALFDPAVNVRLGTAYLAYLLRRYGDPRVAVAAYHAGPGRVDRWLAASPLTDPDLWVERIPIAATRRYVQSVYRSYRLYQALYGSAQPAPAPGPVPDPPGG